MITDYFWLLFLHPGTLWQVMECVSSNSRSRERLSVVEWERSRSSSPRASRVSCCVSAHGQVNTHCFLLLQLMLCQASLCFDRSVLSVTANYETSKKNRLKKQLTQYTRLQCITYLMLYQMTRYTDAPVKRISSILKEEGKFLLSKIVIYIYIYQ